MLQAAYQAEMIVLEEVAQVEAALS